MGCLRDENENTPFLFWFFKIIISNVVGLLPLQVEREGSVSHIKRKRECHIRERLICKFSVCRAAATSPLRLFAVQNSRMLLICRAAFGEEPSWMGIATSKQPSLAHSYGRQWLNFVF